MKKIDLVFVITFAFLFLVLGIKNVDRAVDSGWHDTGWYLKNALEIKENGAFSGFWRDCLNGTYTEANQHPLYILSISPFASHSLKFFAKAKLVSLFFGWLTILILYYLAFSLYGRGVAALSVLLTSMNFYMLRESSHVAAEMLLVLTGLLAWYFIVRGFDNNKYWILAGLFSGLAYLSKGSGIFFIFIFVLAVFMIKKLSILRNKYFYFFFVAFVLAAFPLLWRNVIVYHNPIYNLNSHVMWLDNWKQTYEPAFAQNPPNVFDYFQTHSLKTAIMRMVKGSKRELIVLFDTLKLIGYFQWLYVGAFLGFFAFLGFIFDSNTVRRTVNFLFLGIFFLFFAWYNPIVADARFILPIMPVLFILTAVAIKAIFLSFIKITGGINASKLKKIKSLAFVLVLIFAWSLSAVNLFSGEITNPLYSYRKAPGYDELLSWLKEHLKKNENYILWPAHAYWFEWYAKLPGSSVPFPEVQNFSELQDFIVNKKIHWIIIHKEIILDRKAIVQDYFGIDPRKGIIQKKAIAGWQLEYKPPLEPVPFLIFKVVVNQ